MSTYNIFTSLLSLSHIYLVLILLLLLYFFHFLMATLHRNGHALESIIALFLIKTGRKLDCILWNTVLAYITLIIWFLDMQWYPVCLDFDDITVKVINFQHIFFKSCYFSILIKRDIYKDLLMFILYLQNQHKS